MDDLSSSLQALGFEWPTPAYLIGMLLFSLAGYAAFRYGRKNQRTRITWLGVALMFYPYVVSQTWLLYIVGFALCGIIWFDRG